MFTTSKDLVLWFAAFWSLFYAVYHTKLCSMTLAWFTYSTLHADLHALECMGACKDDVCMDGCMAACKAVCMGTCTGCMYGRVNGCVYGCHSNSLYYTVAQFERWQQLYIYTLYTRPYTQLYTRPYIWPYTRPVYATIHTPMHASSIHAPIHASAACTAACKVL